MFSPSRKIEHARKYQVTIEPLLYTHKKNKMGNHPVKLKITFNRKTKFYPIQYLSKNIALSKDEWLLIGAQKVKGKLSAIKDSIEAMRLNAVIVNDRILSGGFPFTFTRFETLLFANEVTDDFFQVFEDYLQSLFEQKRFGSYRCYLCTYNSFKAFVKSNKTLSPYDITVDLLNRFEKYLRIERKAGITTVGIYTRQIRTIYNVCASKDIKLKEIYPFGNDRNGKYKVKDSRKGSRQGGALTVEELKKLLSSSFDKHSPLHEAKQYWLFSFYCQGMNFKDICFLKYKNIHRDVIVYTRQKTKRTEEQEVIEVPLSKEIKEIIAEFGNKDMAASNYVFPLIDTSVLDEYKVEKMILQRLHVTNKWLSRLSSQVDIPKITTYWSRHTYASLLKFSGVPVEMIRELLGHSDIKTTEFYLKRFDSEAKRLVNQSLLQYIEGA